MAWVPTIDTGLGTIGLLFTVVGVWVSWKSLKEAELAKNAAQSAEGAAKDARDSVRREDRKALLIAKLTSLLTQTNELRANDANLFQGNCEPKLIELRRELVNCASAAAASYPQLTERLRLAATSLDDLDEGRVGDEAAVITIRKRLLIDVGHTISEVNSELGLGIYDYGK